LGQLKERSGKANNCHRFQLAKRNMFEHWPINIAREAEQVLGGAVITGEYAL